MNCPHHPDCPFSHRCRLLLEEEGIAYTVRTIDLDKKPEWFLALSPSGSVPLLLVMRGAGDDNEAPAEVVDGSGAICEYIMSRSNGRNAEVSCRVDETAAAAAALVFPRFVRYIKKQSGADESERRELFEALRGVETVLSDGRVFICGPTLCPTVDFDFAPKLHHMYVALSHHKREIFRDRATGDPLFPNLDRYMATMRSRASWKKTEYPDALVIEGWAKHVPRKEGEGGAGSK